MDRAAWKKILVGEFSFKRVVRSAVFVYVCLLVYALVWSDKMIFQPHSPGYEDGDKGILKIETPGGLLMSALYLNSPESEFTVLYNHANAVDLADIRSFLEEYHRRGFSVLSYDYRGYGTTPGRSTSHNACRSADAALAYLTAELGIPCDRIIVHGRSVGGGPAVYLAHRNAVAGLIVESSFVTAFRAMTRVPLTPFDKFRNIARIDEVDCPVLVMHGKSDNTIPCWHGEKLFKKAREPKMSCWLEGTTHDCMPAEAETAYWNAIASFAKSLQKETGT